MVMKFTAERQPLLVAARSASLPVRRMHIPVLECLRVVAKDNRLRLIGTDMDSAAQASCDATVTEAGEANIDAATLRSALEAASSDTVDIAFDGNTLSLRSGPLSVSLSVNPQAFPKTARPEGEIEAGDISEALNFCAPVMTRTDARPWAQGVAVTCGYALAYDGALLAWCKIDSEASGNIPAQAIPMIARAKGRLFLSERSWRSESENLVLSGKLVDQMPPDFWQKIVVPGGLLASLDGSDMKGAVSGAAIGGAADIAFSVCNTSATVSGESRGAGSAARDSSCSIGCDADGDYFFLMNARRMAIMASALSGSVVDIRVNANDAIAFYPRGGSERGFAIMPLKDHRTVLRAKEAASEN